MGPRDTTVVGRVLVSVERPVAWILGHIQSQYLNSYYLAWMRDVSQHVCTPPPLLHVADVATHSRALRVANTVCQLLDSSNNEVSQIANVPVYAGQNILAGNVTFSTINGTT